MRRTIFTSLAFVLLLFGTAVPQNGRVGSDASTVPEILLPTFSDSVKFLVVGDTGTGGQQQRELADLMRRARAEFAYDFVLLVGDNLYGGEKPADFKRKFEDVYRPLLDGGVKFYASLGNHDESNQRFYELFNMNGVEYYRFRKGDISFYALNSNYLDKRQIKWFEDEMAADRAPWKIAFFHHPPYSSGRKHGSSEGVREVLEPIFLSRGVDAVFNGHEHFYERIWPQQGIYYFITGAGGKLRKGDVKDNSPLTVKAFDTDLSFMLVEIKNEVMYIQAISRTGATVDLGTLPKRRK